MWYISRESYSLKESDILEKTGTCKSAPSLLRLDFIVIWDERKNTNESPVNPYLPLSGYDQGLYKTLRVKIKIRVNNGV